MKTYKKKIDFWKFVRPLSALVTVLVIGWVARLGFEAEKLPPPLDESAPSAVFSAARAAKELDAIAGSNTPRPLGSPEAMRVHDYILARLKSLGYSPSEQNTLVCRGGMGCTNVRNVVARNREPDGSGMVLLVSHYDSVAAGPGAGDDGSGVAVALEAARAIKQNPDPSERAIGFLFDEGEEEGLFGAAAFVEQHAWMRDVKSVVNVDARGTHGNSLLFEMFGDTDAIAKRASEVLPRPWASSLLATVYSHMPNDTDLTMFRRFGGGLSGANLAFLEGVARYHTSGDNVDALDRSTLQAQGENALALTRGFASPSFAAGPMSEGTFFDVLHRHIVCANLMVTWVLAGLAFIVSAIAIGRLPVRFAWFGKSVAALLWLVCGLVFAAVGVTLYGWAAEHMGALPAPVIAEPKYLIAAFLSVALAAIVATTYLATRNDRGYAPEPERTSAVAWFLFAIIGVATAVVAPGVAYLFALPALVAGIVRIALPKAGHLAEAAGGALLALLATPIVLLLYEALGFGVPAAFALPIALFLLPIAPLVAEGSRVVLALFAAVLVIASVFALRAPAFTVANPQRVDVVYTRDVSRSTSEVAIDTFWGEQRQGDVPRAMKSAIGDDATPGAILPWSGHLALRKELGVATKDLLPPSIDNKTEERGDTSRIVRFHLVPPPGARVIALAVRDSSPLTSAQIAGREWPQAYVGSGDSRWRLLILRAPPVKGTDVSLSITGSLPVEARLQATMSGLPTVANAVVEARPPTAMASQDGDRSVIVTQLSL